MILDSSLVTLRDGERKPAMDCYPGRELLSFKSGKAGRSTVHEKRVENHKNIVRLLLSTGVTLTGSWDQPVAIVKEKNLRFAPISEVCIGDKLRGERAGIPTTIDVIGKSTVSVETRLVGFDTSGSTYVANGVLCR